VRRRRSSLSGRVGLEVKISPPVGTPEAPASSAPRAPEGTFILRVPTSSGWTCSQRGLDYPLGELRKPLGSRAL